MTNEILFCKKCKMYRGFYDRGDFYECCGCKRTIKKEDLNKDEKTKTK